jgi:hypothetical protein
MKHNYTFEIQQTQYNQYFYKIYQDRDFIYRSTLFNQQQEAYSEAADLCDDYNNNYDQHISNPVIGPNR